MRLVTEQAQSKERAGAQNREIRENPPAAAYTLRYPRDRRVQSSAVSFTGHVWEGMWQSTSKRARFSSLRKGVKHIRSTPAFACQKQTVENISVGFITCLPTSSGGNDTILTFVDRLTKQAHFVPTKGCKCK